MDKELIERLVKDAGFQTYETSYGLHLDEHFDFWREMERFANLVAEECLSLIPSEQGYDGSESDYNTGHDAVVKELRASIRALFK